VKISAHPDVILGAGAGIQQQDMITAHADVVGSLLRPPWLLEAQQRLRAREITRPAYKSIEDRAVNGAVAQQ
jgi:5-methyltetrahydropteroyltriglutamate--homocysteine methyltransferase